MQSGFALSIFFGTFTYIMSVYTLVNTDSTPTQLCIIPSWYANMDRDTIGAESAQFNIEHGCIDSR